MAGWIDELMSAKRKLDAAMQTGNGKDRWSGAGQIPKTKRVVSEYWNERLWLTTTSILNSGNGL